MFRFLTPLLFAFLLGGLPWQVAAAPAFEDTMAQRTLACVACHGNQGRAGPDGYYPRLAGKPVGYLYNQLLNLRDGRRHYGLMTGLVAPLSDTYLLEIAQYFSRLDVPYPPPLPNVANASVMLRGAQLVKQGDSIKNIPACIQCHGSALTGVQPHIPGLLGLPRDYLNAQLGGWQTQQRRAQAPDCMAHIAGRMSGEDVNAVGHWLAAQAVPANSRAIAALPPLPPGAQRLDCGSANLPPAMPTQMQDTAPITATSVQISQGAYLAQAGNCMTCHTPQGGTPFAGGRAINTPFGTVFSSNLTPDKATGLGNWTPSDFWQAIHDGRSRDGRLLNPAFPYTSYTQMTRADTDALFAYLQTLPARQQPNAPHALRWPFGTQAAMFAWRALYFSPGVYQPDPAQTAEWNRGAYLVRGAGHCAACHTPRNAMGASQNEFDLSGGSIAMQNWYAPSLHDLNEAGTSALQRQQLVTLLKTGISPSGTVSGPMAEVVRDGTQHMTTSDLTAMSVFLTSLTDPTQAAPKMVRQNEASQPVSGNGARLYEAQCIQCHGAQGQGVAGAYPALAQNRAVTMNNPANLVQMVLYGGYAPATAGNPRPFGMPPFVLEMSDREVAEVLSHIRNAWGNQAPRVTELAVTRARAQP